MAAITSIVIENFRCFQKLRVDGLAQVNLIVGANNAGKTALLEAIEVAVSFDKLFPLHRAARERNGYRRHIDAEEEFAGIEPRHWFHGHTLAAGAATNDRWPAIASILQDLGVDTRGGPDGAGAIVSGRYGIWMGPDNISHGDLETFVADIIPQAPLLAYATEVCRIARDDHAAEYELRHARKAALKVRSVWRNASVAGGYGHLVRNLPLTQTAACDAFIAWFRALFLTA